MIMYGTVADGLNTMEKKFPGITELVTQTHNGYHGSYSECIRYTIYALRVWTTEDRFSIVDDKTYAEVTYNEEGILAHLDPHTGKYSFTYHVPKEGVFATSHLFRLDDLKYIRSDHFFHDPNQKLDCNCPYFKFSNFWFS